MALFTPGPIPTGMFAIPLGRADVKREGSDVTVITWGWQVGEALAAAETLAADGTSVEVVDLRIPGPPRPPGHRPVAKTRRALVVHGATTFCGPGAEIAAQITERLFGDLAAPVARLGAAYTPIPFSADLEVFPTVDDVAAAARRLSRVSGWVLRDERQALSRDNLAALAGPLIGALLGADLGPDRRIAVFADNAVETLIVHVAALWAGCSPVPVNSRLTAGEVAHILGDSGTRAVFVGPETAGRAAEAVAACTGAGHGVEIAVVGWRCPPGIGTAAAAPWRRGWRGRRAGGAGRNPSPPDRGSCTRPAPPAAPRGRRCRPAASRGSGRSRSWWRWPGRGRSGSTGRTSWWARSTTSARW